MSQKKMQHLYLDIYSLISFAIHDLLEAHQRSFSIKIRKKKKKRVHQRKIRPHENCLNHMAIVIF